MAASSTNTVMPSDSISNVEPAPKKKNSRPGPRQRRNGSISTEIPDRTKTSGVNNKSKVDTFSKGSAPVIAQPGKFPTVFSTGPGAPTKERGFQYDMRVINSIIRDVPLRYINHPRFPEFALALEYDRLLFTFEFTRSFLLGLAQQTVHAHVNCDFPQGDFSAEANTDVTNFTSVRSILTQFGEFRTEANGHVHSLVNYDTTVKSLVFTALKLDDGDPVERIILRSWLPMEKDDTRSQFIVAHHVSRYIESVTGIELDAHNLAQNVFVLPPPEFTAAATLLGVNQYALYILFGQSVSLGNDGNEIFTDVDYDNSADYVAHLGTPQGQTALTLIGLEWSSPDTSHLNWAFNHKLQFTLMSRKLQKRRTESSKYLSTGSGTSNKSSALGSSTQISKRVAVNEDVYTLESYMSATAPSTSLAVLFPPSGLFVFNRYNVVQSTTLNVTDLATEYQVNDWS